MQECSIEETSVNPVPDLPWHASISESKGLAVRCPFATVEACPRNFASLALLGQAGSTRIHPKEDKRLKAMWKKSDLWPKTDEQAAAISRIRRADQISHRRPSRG